MAERERDEYDETEWIGESWRLLRGDCVEALRSRIEPESVDFSALCGSGQCVSSSWVWPSLVP